MLEDNSIGYKGKVYKFLYFRPNMRTSLLKPLTFPLNGVVRNFLAESNLKEMLLFFLEEFKGTNFCEYSIIIILGGKSVSDLIK